MAIQNTPWTVIPLNCYDQDTGKPIGKDYWITGADGNEITCVDDEETANAMAAAPELLEALRWAKKIIRSWHGEIAWDIYDKSSPEMKAINSAIDKAKATPITTSFSLDAALQKSDLEFMQSILPDHYACHTMGNGVHCKSRIGIEDSPRENMMNVIRQYFADRFLEVFCQVCTAHKSFTVYAKY